MHRSIGVTRTALCFLLAMGASSCVAIAEETTAGKIIDAPAVSGFRGVWYMNQPTKDAFRYKYSGGLGTYPQQHAPIALYSPDVDRTYFCYGGSTGKPNELACMISYFDHAAGKAVAPREALVKQVNDAHENPTLQIDDDGHLWLFCSAHGPRPDAYVLRSVEPHQIDRFEVVERTNFSYSQPWFIPGDGFLFLHTRYEGGKRMLYWKTSRDGRQWSAASPLARIESGHYQISRPRKRGAATAFNFHPAQGGLNARTNLYYLATDDMGATWRNAAGKEVALPLTETPNEALVHDYQAEGKLVYLKDLAFDAQGNPVLLYLTSSSYEPGPPGGVRQWHTARWTGARWELRDAMASDHNYDFGSLYIEPDKWIVIAPTDPGPQPDATGGEMVLWTSANEGSTWVRAAQLTEESELNHTYARRPQGARPDFFALWADGNSWERSPSRLYYFDRSSGLVRVLPESLSPPPGE